MCLKNTVNNIKGVGESLVDTGNEALITGIKTYNIIFTSTQIVVKKKHMKR